MKLLFTDSFMFLWIVHFFSNFLSGGFLAYMILTIFLRKYTPITCYINVFLFIALLIVLVTIYPQLDEISKHAAHGAPLFMLIGTIFIISLFVSGVFFVGEWIKAIMRKYYKYKK